MDIGNSDPGAVSAEVPINTREEVSELLRRTSC